MLESRSQEQAGQSQQAQVVKPKRMLAVRKENGRTVVEINYSSLELIQTCLRKAHYSLNQKLKLDDDAPALLFGKAIHGGLEHWYTLPLTERKLDDKLRETAEGYAYGHGIDIETSGALESIRRFALACIGKLPADDDKRSLTNGIKILRAYFKTYADDMLVVARDEHGPIIERDFEFTIWDEPDLLIRYFGTIDVVLENLQTGLKMVADHKTTSSLGTEFYARCKPNPQYTGYVMGAQRCLGINTELFMVNGLQVAKTMQQFARQVTRRTEEDFAELKRTVVHNVKRWLAAEADGYPQSAPNPCSMYGGCQYLTVCEIPEKLRESVIRSKWPSVMS